MRIQGGVMMDAETKSLRAFARRMPRFEGIIADSYIRLSNFKNKNWIKLKDFDIDMLMGDGTVLPNPTITSDGIYPTVIAMDPPIKEYNEPIPYKDIVFVTVSETYWFEDLNLSVKYLTRFDRQTYTSKVIITNTLLTGGHIVDSENDVLAYWLPPMLDYMAMSTFTRNLNRRHIPWDLEYYPTFGFCVRVNNKCVIVNPESPKHYLTLINKLETSYTGCEMLKIVT
jgi:hypothetical protein